MASAVSSGELWSDKYRPTTISEMCYPACANKLREWLENFEPAGKAGSDLRRPRAALLSGPPGIGKTTTVHVVAREMGNTVVEYNASDFRSMKSLREKVSDVIDNRTFASSVGSYTNIILLMDEVDGCDRGGVAEVIEMIKNTAVPIVCTCNDRWHPKLRSLVNYVEDIRVSRPPCNVVANFLYDRVLAREGVTLSKPLLQDIVKRSGSDIRSMLNNLQMWCMDKKNLEQRQLAECAVQSEKNGDVGLFEAAEYMLLQGTSKGERHTIEEMQTCYYNSDLLDMFIQENYLHFNPQPTEGRDWMGAVTAAAECISRGDAASRIMYYQQNWSVSRCYVLCSCIAPCVYTRGKYESFLTGQQVFFDRQRPVKFPSLLGQGSTAGKNRRLLQCVAAQATHPVKGISGHQEDLVLDYIPRGFEHRLTSPLAERGKDGIAEVIGFMDQYGLMRDDWDLVQTLPHFKRFAGAGRPGAGAGAPLLRPVEVPTAVKSAFTREFNKTHKLESFTKTALAHTTTGETLPDGWGDKDEDDGDESQKKEVLPKRPAAKAKKAPAKAAATAKKKAPASPTERKTKRAPSPSMAKKAPAKKRAKKETNDTIEVSSSSSDAGTVTSTDDDDD